ncbi:DUF1850 domain-containing protein [Lysinibacillus fusiformis]|uniref:DUF1850 domain-containing protein n=1 Tax=Lysinibacillus fusiformis TaxID=28031 RepID=UPI003CED54E1
MQQRKVSIAVVLVIFCLISVAILPFQKVFTFTETRTANPRVYYIPITENEKFQIRYTHSIHNSDVFESYQYAKGNRIQMLEMEYEDLAIGMPGYAEEGQTFIERDGKYVLQFDNHRVIDNFTILIGDLDLDLVFNYEGMEYDLKKDLQRGKSYLFEIRQLSLYEQWKGVRMK